MMISASAVLARVRVHDTGVVVPAADQTRVFDRFHRGAYRNYRRLGWGCGSSARSPRRASFTVTSTSDAVDASIGDGVCRTSGGVCTLRAAVQEANDTTAADTVVVPAGHYGLTLDGTGENGAGIGDLDVTRPLTVLGAGADTTVVDANGLDRVVELGETSGRVTLRGLTLREGVHDEIGGALHNASAATVRLEDVTSRSCSPTP